MSEGIKKILEQIRLEALKASWLHQRQIHSLCRKNLFVEFLTLAVPVFYIIPRFLAKGTLAEDIFEFTWELLAGLLLVLAILRLVSKWQDNEMKHYIADSQDQDIACEALELMNRNISMEVFEQFNKRSVEADKRDNELLGIPSEREDKKAYVDALKKMHPGKITLCFRCHTSPWERRRFKRNSCVLCGAVTKMKYTSVNP